MIEVLLLAVGCFTVSCLFFAHRCDILSTPDREGQTYRLVDMETGLPWAGEGTLSARYDE